jgi:rfaE bifunctional protein nucleotidyltransferase chain/domain
MSPPHSRTDAPAGVVDLDTLLAQREDWRAAGLTVVWTNGSFDLLHVGHVRNLQGAAALGDVLIVGVNSDASVRRLKGEERPFLPAEERAEMLAALKGVDYVVVFDEDTPEQTLARLQPDVHVKGEDYLPPHGKPIPEAATVEAYGGRIAFLPMVPGRSTTTLAGDIRRHS